MTREIVDAAQPLTVLAEDEAIFRDSVRAFAEAQVGPLVRDMDEHARIPRTLIDQLFEWWMIIAIPVVAMLTFTLSHWITTSVIEPAKD